MHIREFKESELRDVANEFTFVETEIITDDPEIENSPKLRCLGEFKLPQKSDKWIRVKIKDDLIEIQKADKIVGSSEEKTVLDGPDISIDDVEEAIDEFHNY